MSKNILNLSGGVAGAIMALVHAVQSAQEDLQGRFAKFYDTVLEKMAASASKQSELEKKLAEHAQLYQAASMAITQLQEVTVNWEKAVARVTALENEVSTLKAGQQQDQVRELTTLLQSHSTSLQTLADQFMNATTETNNRFTQLEEAITKPVQAVVEPAAPADNTVVEEPVAEPEQAPAPAPEVEGTQS